MLALILLALAIGDTYSYLIRVPTSPTQPRIAPVGWVHIQKLMLPLFENVCDQSNNPVVLRLAEEFVLDSTDYTKAGVVEAFNNCKSSKGLLAKNEIFTEYNVEHLTQFKALYELFYHAKDFDSFYKVACWARINVNCGLFVNSLYLAIMNRIDTSRISVPAPYELLPNYFIDKEVIMKASKLLSESEIGEADDVRVEGNSYILNAKYTTEITDNDEDSKLAYFREDVGLNAYYFLRKLRNAPWFNAPPSTDSLYGEYMYLMMKQFAARYDLERYSHGLTELEGIAWDFTINAYNPMLIYTNGNDFGHRTFAGVVGDSEELTILKTIESNFATVVTHLKQAGRNKTEILNHLMEILVTSDNNYEKFARLLVCSDISSGVRSLSVLDHYLTSIRDPIFWKINKKIVQLVDNALKVLPGYVRSELYFPGVEVLNVETKKMMTSFDNYQFDVTDSLKTGFKNTTFQVKIEQSRLNHKPFIIKLNVSSLVVQKGLLKIYIGPKTMPGELILKKNLFVLLDRFEINLKRGFNIISRSSTEMTNFSDDFISLRTIEKKVEDAEFGLDALSLKGVESQVGYPSRLILPKGLPEGLPLQLFIFVAPFYRNVEQTAANKMFNSVILSPGYPLDLVMDDSSLFNLPNALVKDVTVTHKSETKPGNYGGNNGPKSWDSNNGYGSRFNNLTNKADNNGVLNVVQNDYYDSSVENKRGLLGDRPAFTYKNKDTNYGPKRNQYGKKEEYASKRTDYSKRVFNDKQEIVNEYVTTTTKSEIPRTDQNNFEYLTVIPLTTNMNKYTAKPENLEQKDQNVDKITNRAHGLLGAKAGINNKYLNKDSFDYVKKPKQYKTKVQSEAKNIQYKKKYPQNKDIGIVNIVSESNTVEPDTKHTNKYILINSQNNTEFKNKIKDSSTSGLNFNKINSEKVDTVTKEIKINPINKNINEESAESDIYKTIENNKKIEDYTINKEILKVPVNGKKIKQYTETDNIPVLEKDISVEDYTITKEIRKVPVNKNGDKESIKMKKKPVLQEDRSVEDYTITREIRKVPINKGVVKGSSEINKKTVFEKDESVEDLAELPRITVVYEPIFNPDEMPKRKFSVYDFLFNLHDEDNKVYE